LQFETVKNETTKFVDIFTIFLQNAAFRPSGFNFEPKLGLDSNPDPSVENEYGSATLQSMQCNHDTNDTAHKTKNNQNHKSAESLGIHLFSPL
jgi:hypothetical protein